MCGGACVNGYQEEGENICCCKCRQFMPFIFRKLINEWIGVGEGGFGYATVAVSWLDV
jgi:hypothetical protein